MIRRLSALTISSCLMCGVVCAQDVPAEQPETQPGRVETPTDPIDPMAKEELEEVAALFSRMMRCQLPGEEAIDDLGDLRALSGVRQFPIRIKCALLAWSAVEEGLEEYRREQK